MRRVLVLAILLSASFAARAGAVGVEDNAGLRLARYIGPTRIGLLFGPGFGDYQFDKKAFVYQVVSATDESFRHGVAAEKIEMLKTEPDAAYPDGWKGPEFTRYIVTADLPKDKAMAPGHKYWIRISSRGVTGNSCAAKYIIPAQAVKPAKLRPRYGIREMYVLSPSAIHLITGAGIDVERLGDTANVTIALPEDPDFRDPVHPERLGRRSNLDFYIPQGWPWQFCQRHEPLSAGTVARSVQILGRRLARNERRNNVQDGPDGVRVRAAGLAEMMTGSELESCDCRWRAKPHYVPRHALRVRHRVHLRVSNRWRIVHVAGSSIGVAVRTSFELDVLLLSEIEPNWAHQA